MTWLEDCAYRRLLDVYYSREQFIPGDVSQACRLVRANSKDERKAVVTVLNEFFTLVDSCWSNTRCDEEIQKSREAAARSKANGMKGGRPIKNNQQQTQQVTSGLLEQTQSKPDPKAPNPNPNTNTKVIPPKSPKGDSDGFEEFWTAYPRKDAKPIARKAFLKVTAPLPVLLTAIARQRTTESWTKDGGKFIPMPASWLNAERWNDGVVTVVEIDGDTRASVEREGIDKGIGPWDGIIEPWLAYKTRVRGAKTLPRLDLSRLEAMAERVA